MFMATAKGYHHRATFAEGPRRPLTKREKSDVKARFEQLRRTQPGFTALHVIVLSWLVDRVGYDGRCDPSHATIAQATGVNISTVKRAILKAVDLGLMTSTMRLIRAGGRVLQRTCAYLFPSRVERAPVGDNSVRKPEFPPDLSVAQSEREPRSSDLESYFLTGRRVAEPVENSRQRPIMAQIEAIAARTHAWEARKQGGIE